MLRDRAPPDSATLVLTRRAVNVLTLYYLVWLLAALALIALSSAIVVLRARRRSGARALADALSRYATWMAAQRGQLTMDIGRELAESALHEAQALQARDFPQLAPTLQALLATDRKLTHWLQRQKHLRHRNPETWLALQAERYSRQLLRAQDDTLDEMRRRLVQAVRVGGASWLRRA